MSFRRGHAIPSQSGKPASPPSCGHRPARGACGLPFHAGGIIIPSLDLALFKLVEAVWSLLLLPVALSRAATRRMPLASISNVTSICGSPARRGGDPSRRKRPRLILSAAIGRSPWSTWISTARLVVFRVGRKLRSFEPGLFIPFNQGRHHTASVSTPGIGSHVQQRGHPSPRRPGHPPVWRRLQIPPIRVDALVRLFTGQRAHQILHHRQREAPPTSTTSSTPVVFRWRLSRQH